MNAIAGAAAPPPRRIRKKESLFGGWPGIIAVELIVIAFLVSDEWLLALSLFVLYVGCRLLARNDATPVAAAAFTYQWLQVTIALFYASLFGRQLEEMTMSEYRPMVLVGLGAISAMFAGYLLASPKQRERSIASSEREARAMSILQIALPYAFALVASIALRRVAWSLPSLTQILLVLGLARYALLFMLIRRLLVPVTHLKAVIAVLCLELALGFTGFFADFREPIAIMALAVLGASTRRRKRTWIAIILIGLIGVSAAVTWTAIKPVLRERYEASSSRVERLTTAVSLIGPVLSSSGDRIALQVDRLVSRIWAMYYPSLALARVPSVLPHENGAIVGAAVKNILTPRFLFPNKGILPSDSDKVRKYSGVWVAGRETMTSFAFGYTAEAYVDFGWPMLLIPIFLYGCMMGLVDRTLHRFIRSDRILAGVRVVILWTSLYLFESSWVIMLGQAITTALVLGGGAVLADRLIGRRHARGPAIAPQSVLAPIEPQARRISSS